MLILFSSFYCIKIMKAYRFITSIIGSIHVNLLLFYRIKMLGNTFQVISRLKEMFIESMNDFNFLCSAFFSSIEAEYFLRPFIIV